MFYLVRCEHTQEALHTMIMKVSAESNVDRASARPKIPCNTMTCTNKLNLSLIAVIVRNRDVEA